MNGFKSRNNVRLFLMSQPYYLQPKSDQCFVMRTNLLDCTAAPSCITTHFEFNPSR